MSYRSDGDFNTLKKLSEDTVISLKGIHKSFKISKSETIRVLKGIDIHDSSDIESIKKGEFVMIRGPSGCGKTTLMNIIGTFDTPTEGTVVINNKEVKQESDNFKSEIRLNYLGVVFQNYNLLNTLTVNENVRLPLEMAAKLKEKEINKKVEELLKAVGMLNRGNHLPAQLSGGQQQRAYASLYTLLFILYCLSFMFIFSVRLHVHCRTVPSCFCWTSRPETWIRRTPLKSWICCLI